MGIEQQMEIAQLREQLQSQHHRLSVYANLIETLAIALIDEDDYDEAVRLLENQRSNAKERHGDDR